MRQSVDDVKRLVSILGEQLEFTSVREDFGQIVVCVEARMLEEKHVSSLKQFADGVTARQNGSAGATVDLELPSNRVYYMPPERGDNGEPVELKSFRDELKNAGIKVSPWK